MKRICGVFETLLLVAVIGHHTAVFAQSPGRFIASGNMVATRAFHAAIPLPTGKVLIVDSTSAEIYDPDTGTSIITSIPSPSSSATLLGDGRVLIIGGDVNGKNRAGIYDPVTQTLTLTGSTVTGQIGGWATLLRSGKVLVAGGVKEFVDNGPSPIARPELYDPSTGAFVATGPFATTASTFYFTGGPNISAVSLLSDGKVLFAAEPDSELYDPSTGTFRVTGWMKTQCFNGQLPRYIYGRSATLLPNGKVLLLGGADDCGRFADAELYDPATETFLVFGRMTRARDNHVATLLLDGSVLITGGETEDCAGVGCSFAGTTATAETYSPSTGTFQWIGGMTFSRAGHTATLLENGTVLFTGGYAFGGIGLYYGTTTSAEIYVPFVGQASGSGSSAKLILTFADTAGVANMGVVNALVNNTLDGRNACYLAYVPSTNSLYLVNDMGDAAGPYVDMLLTGSSGSIENSQCRIDGAGSRATAIGTSLVLTLNTTFKASFAGNRIVHLAHRDTTGYSKGWQPVGVWRVPGAPVPQITVDSQRPARGVSTGVLNQALTYTITDTAGVSDLGVMNVLINDSIDGRLACYVAYVRSSNQLFLVNDSGEGGGPFAGQMTLNGTAVSIENNVCRIDGVGSFTTSSGNTLNLTLNISYKAGFRGNHVVYGAARDRADSHNTGWQALGTWSVQ